MPKVHHDFISMRKRKRGNQTSLIGTLSPQSMRLNLIYVSLILIISLSPILYQKLYAQEPSIEQTEEELKTASGLDKLEVLNRLTEYYHTERARKVKALRYGRQAVTLGENLFVKSSDTIRCQSALLIEGLLLKITVLDNFSSV